MTCDICISTPLYTVYETQPVNVIITVYLSIYISILYFTKDKAMRDEMLRKLQKHYSINFVYRKQALNKWFFIMKNFIETSPPITKYFNV